MDSARKCETALTAASLRQYKDQSSEEQYFQRRLNRAETFWLRFSKRPELATASVLDFGSGYGALSVFAANQGAKCVVGIDPDRASVLIAERLIRDQYPHLVPQIVFQAQHPPQLPQEAFDVAMSTAVFEHVLDLGAALASVYAALKPNGVFLIGLGPLYYSPWGDHHRTEAPLCRVLPWAHLIFPERWLIKRRNRNHPSEVIESIRELGLNQLKVTDYRNAFERSDFVLESFEVNRIENAFASHALRRLRQLPVLSELLAFNIYTVLRKPRAG